MKILNSIINFSIYHHSQQSLKVGNYAEYLAKKQTALKKSHIPVKYWTLDKFDMDKLEGIQEGLKTIGNLTMKQIKSIADRTLAVILQRGCNNMCAHCYADARPESFYRDKNTIAKIDFEDFKNFCDDFQTLNDKMGFNIFKRKRMYNYQVLFHDADSSMITAKDKTGKEYDYLDLSKMLHDTCNEEILFDTAGWNVQDKNTQKRMENLVEKFNKNYADYKFVHFNLSFNPFQSLYYNSVLKEREGQHDVAQRLREAYTTRMANTISTLLPILMEHPERFGVISRSFSNEKIQELEGFQQKDLAKLYGEVLLKVEKMFMERYEKYNTKQQLDIAFKQICDYFLENCDLTNTNIGITGRLIKNFKVKNTRKTMDEIFPNANDKIICKNMDAALIDLNGKVYITNYQETYPTNIQLNYINKNKYTAPIKPVLHEHIVEI